MAKTLLTTWQVKIFDKKDFAKATLDKICNIIVTRLYISKITCDFSI